MLNIPGLDLGGFGVSQYGSVFVISPLSIGIQPLILIRILLASDEN